MNSAAYLVYIITNDRNTTFYIGITNNLSRRIEEHKLGLVDSFSKRYNLKKLIYVEEYPSAIEAITREKQLKNWHRPWKINLIKTMNPEFKELIIE